MGSTVWILIPVHNRMEMTRACLDSLFQQAYRQYHVMVMDDGSSDGSGDMIAQCFPKAHLLRGDGKLYWTGAINLGVKEVMAQAGDQDYILTLNNDVVVQPDYLEKLVRFAGGKTRSLIGSIALDHSQQKKVLDAGVRIHWKTARFEHLFAGRHYLNVLEGEKDFQEVDDLPGRGTLIPVSAFKEVGLYNARKLPHYAADYEFSIRAKRAGYRLYVNYKAIVSSQSRDTGLDNSGHSLCWTDYFKSFVSIRSPNNLYYRWNFSKLCCPGLKGFTFYMMDTARVVLGTLRNQFIHK